MSAGGFPYEADLANEGIDVSGAMTASARTLRPWSFRAMNRQLQHNKQTKERQAAKKRPSNENNRVDRVSQVCAQRLSRHINTRQFSRTSTYTLEVELYREEIEINYQHHTLQPGKHGHNRILGRPAGFLTQHQNKRATPQTKPLLKPQPCVLCNHNITAIKVAGQVRGGMMTTF